MRAKIKLRGLNRVANNAKRVILEYVHTDHIDTYSFSEDITIRNFELFLNH